MTLKKVKSLGQILITICALICLPNYAFAQSENKSATPSKIAESDKGKTTEPDLIESQRRALAISQVISLANEARSYEDLALRPSVLARAADVLWDADKVTARALFIRAWEAAEKGDAEDVTVKTKDNPPAMVIALRRMSGHDLRSEVVSVTARRDRALAEEFLSKLKSQSERETANAKDSSPRDNWTTSEAATKRLLIAGKLLAEGQIDLALEFAAPVLDQVNARSIDFLSELRAKEPARADQLFAALLARAELDPASDANTVSGLSSYAFTPGLYICFWADGTTTWSQPNGPTTPPNLPTALRNRFLQVAASILLRPLLPPGQDSSTAGRNGKYNVIRRLLPLFDQYAPDSATALRSQLTSMANKSPGEPPTSDRPLLTEGIKPPDNVHDTLEKMQDRLDHAKSSEERDQIYAAAAAAIAPQGELRARDLADEIDKSEFRSQVRGYVDYELVRVALQNKHVDEAVRLARTGQLTHPQRAWAYSQAGRLMEDSQRERALSLLDEAAEEARRIAVDDPDRALSLIGVAIPLFTADRVRAWELMTEVVKAANSNEKWTGDDRAVRWTMVVTRSGTRFTRMPAEDFSFSRVLRLLAREDLERAIDLARGLKNEGPHAAATLAIAGAILEERTGAPDPIK